MSEGAPPAPSGTARIVHFADLAGTLVFAIEGGLAGLAIGLDPVGVLVVSFLTALGGGLIRDVVIGALPPAAVANPRYSLIVLAAAVGVWVFHGALMHLPPGLLAGLDAAGLALFAVAGTDKALDRGISPVVAVFLGTVSGVGGGTMRDVVLNQVPRVLYTDIYATAAALAAVLVAAGRAAGLPARTTAVAAGLACFALRMIAWRYGWHLPRMGVE